jgi:hypothetical protein
MGAALLALKPRRWVFAPQGITKNAETLDQILACKQLYVNAGGVFFWLASGSLVLVVASILICS